MMRTHFLFLLCVFFFLFFSLSIAKAQQPKSVLFVGNSYTFFNKMPLMVQKIAASKGYSLKITSRVGNAYSYKKHLADSVFYKTIKQENFDRVVLQEWHVLSGYPSDLFATESLPYAKSIVTIIKEHQPCAQLLLSMPWGKKTGNNVDCQSDYAQCTYEGLFQRTKNNFNTLHDSLALPVSPVGVIWDQVRGQFPWINLYDVEDNHHPSLEGSYLTACVHFAALFHESPIGAYYPNNLPADIALKLQTAALEGIQAVAMDWGLEFIEPNQEVLANFMGDSVVLVSQIQQFDQTWWEQDGLLLGQTPQLVMAIPDGCPFMVTLCVSIGSEIRKYPFRVALPGALTVNAVLTEPTCSQSTNGAIELNVLGGQEPYLNSWSTGSTASIVSGLTLGQYAVTITDNAGCSVTQTMLLTKPVPAEVRINKTDPCVGSQSGMIKVSSLGADSITSCNWSTGLNGSTTQINNLSAGIYTVTATIQSGCTATKMILLESKDDFIAPTNLNCIDSSFSSLTIGWDLSSCADGYTLYLKLATSLSWTTVVHNVSPNVGQYTFLDLQPGSKYKFKVAAFKNGVVKSSLIYQPRTLLLYYYDGDLDSVGQSDFPIVTNNPFPNLSAFLGDCDDSDPLSKPGSIELCDQKDNNCNGFVDENIVECPQPDIPLVINATSNSFSLQWKKLVCANSYLIRYKEELDVDWTFLSMTSMDTTTTISVVNSSPNQKMQYGIQSYCSVGGYSFWSGVGVLVLTEEPYVASTLPDPNPCENPLTPELSNEIDDNCNGLTDEGLVGTFFLDVDQDGFGDSSVIFTDCNGTFAHNSNDCNDNNVLINPNATELCNGIDDNCNGVIDENGTIQAYIDADADGFGAGAAVMLCQMLPGYAATACDCNNTNAVINPNALEIAANLIDDDCNGIIDDACSKNVNLTTVKFVKQTPTTLLVLFDLVNDATYYQLRYRPFGTTTWITKSSNVGKIQLTGLTTNTQYGVIFRTQCAAGYTTFGTSLNVTTGSNSSNCAKPVLGDAKYLSVSSARTYWNYTSNATKYQVRYRVNTTGSTWVVKTTVLGALPEINLDFLTLGVNYVWQVAAWCPSGTTNVLSSYSALGYYTHAAPTTACSTSGVALMAFEPNQNHNTSAVQLQNDVKLYPNPTQNTITIESLEIGHTTCLLYDLTYRQLEQWHVEEDKQVLDLSNYPAGVYLLRIELINGSWITRKVMRE
jgi:Putative metal-binding motif/Secretion system C-terminal sorting domain/Fibronectin type III domain/SprB repeat